jgi:hypothetical protein
MSQTRQPDTYPLPDKSVSDVGSDHDVSDDNDLLQADPDGKHRSTVPGMLMTFGINS